ncbi:MAG TPA: MYXO-CTERM sorting domain-containing protein, partial [Polyangiales bacterium]|nr:MYXO-CTERM sorting domain-containing protein [Polyangiales bacterium]
RALGAAHVQGVALAGDGAAALLDAQVTVATARMSSSAGCATSSDRAGPVSAGLGLWAAALLLKRRRRLRAGNRLGPGQRSARSERHP